jgi:serine/threonine protein kinase
MGEVYRARDTKLNRDVALKVLPEAMAANPERRARFAREAQAIAALNHPNIVTIHSIEQSDNTHFLTMELVNGTTLDGIIARHGLRADRILAVAIPLVDAISAAHKRGITHRDLKPTNVMVTHDGRLKVLDFGLAKPMDAEPARVSTTSPTGPLTQDGRVFGTVNYMSPEQAEGKAVDHRTDIFSLGIVLYELATGQRPFTGESDLSVLSSILKDAPRPITDVNPALPQELGRIIRRCLAKDPDRRYQTALDLRNELDELKEELAPSKAPLTVNEPRSRRRLWIAIGMIATTVAVHPGSGSKSRGRPPRRFPRRTRAPPFKPRS